MKEKMRLRELIKQTDKIGKLIQDVTGIVLVNEIAVYNICVDIINAKKTISQLEFLNHMQLHTLNLDGLIFEIVNSLPEFYDEKTDGTGSSLAVTVYDYIQFFNSKKGKKLLKKCAELIEIMEKSDTIVSG